VKNLVMLRHGLFFCCAQRFGSPGWNGLAGPAGGPVLFLLAWDGGSVLYMMALQKVRSLASSRIFVCPADPVQGRTLKNTLLSGVAHRPLACISEFLFRHPRIC
jgi:hypothetical protein